MASIPIGGESAPVTIPGSMPPMPAVARILSQFDREKLGNAIEVMIALLDMADPVDDEEPDFALRSDGLPGDALDHEATGDAESGAYIEWHATAPSSRKAGHCIVNSCGNEDDEDDDPDHALDEGEPQFASRRGNSSDGPGCSIGDSDACSAGDDRVFAGSALGCNALDDDRPGDADDAECEQMLQDVPMLPVMTAAYNIFTDQREPLGISNLQSSFRGQARSADSGQMHNSTWRDGQKPGVPV